MSFPSLIVLGIIFCVEANHVFHQDLSEDELIHYFGTPHLHKVPDYDLISPIPVTKKRSRRNTLEYHVTALGEQYNLLLQRNPDLMPTSCLVHYPAINGSSLVEPCLTDGEDCYYFGTSLSHGSSRVAVSTCRGLHGVIITSDHELFIQPIREEHMHRVRREVEFPHIAYRKNITKTTGTTTKKLHRRKRSTKRTVELMVVTDETMHGFHGDDTKRYVMTAVNIAAQRLLDESLETEIHLAVVKLSMISDSQSDLYVTKDAQFTLNKFCKWQEKYNPKGDQNPQHADASALITRLDIQNLGNDDATGLAFINGMCHENQRCSFNQDTGLDLGLTIAHELGHTLGMSHDGVRNSCENGKFLMSSDGGLGSQGLEWSPCSVKALKDFLNSDQSECLYDSPVLRVGGTINQKPGLLYDGDEQCVQSYGRGSSICEGSDLTINGDECARLVCFDPLAVGKCTGSTAPRMDGTHCGEGKWCIKGKCVSYGDDGPKSVDGAWSDWDSDWSECSRTCGGGVKIKTRQCNNPKAAFGGTQCVGKDVQAELCNTADCEKSQEAFKAEQCAATDPIAVFTRTYHWVPYAKSKESDVCVMECEAEGQGIVQNRKDRYQDGTICPGNNPTAFHRCVQAKCRSFGCDGIIESGKIFDMCGECDGKNDTCKEIKGTFKKGKKNEYITFLTIPTGATGIKVTNDNEQTFISVTVNGYRLFNEGGKKDKGGWYRNGLVSAHYRPISPEALLIDGPLANNIDVQVWRKYNDNEFYDVAPNIKYMYHIPLQDKLPELYEWKSKPTHCSTSCGGGLYHMSVTCVKKNGGQNVDKSHCNIRKMPNEFGSPCNTQPCPPNWVMDPFGACTKTCGGGLMRRAVRCVRIQNGQKQIMDNSACIKTEQPPDTFPCNRKPCPGVWKTGSWSACSLTCGRGQQSRDVNCYRDKTSSNKIEDSECLSTEKPDSTKECFRKICKSTRKGAVCADTEDCTQYDVSSCTEFAEWGEKNCPAFCGFCSKQGDSATGCVDAESDCATGYDANVCTEYSEWSKLHCRRHCNLCYTETKPDTRQESTSCSDLADCSSYGDDVCTTYAPWSAINCRRYCGLCSASEENIDPDCVDIENDCESGYGANVCTEYPDWSELNCKKYCNFCNSELSSVDSSCQDTADCASYGDNVCTEFAEWSESNCRHFCNKCEQSRKRRSLNEDAVPTKRNSLHPIRYPSKNDSPVPSRSIASVNGNVNEIKAQNPLPVSNPIFTEKSPSSSESEDELKSLVSGLQPWEGPNLVQESGNPIKLPMREKTHSFPKKVYTPREPVSKSGQPMKSLERKNPPSPVKKTPMKLERKISPSSNKRRMCNQLFTSLNGSLDAFWDTNYAEECQVAISVPPTHTLVLQFPQIIVDCKQGDIMVLSEGSSDGDVNICQPADKFTYSSSSNNVLIRFKVGSVRHSFRMTYTSIPSKQPQLSAGCQQQLNDETGRITSPEREVFSFKGQKCEIAINVKPQSRIRLSFSWIKLLQTDCSSNYVKVVDVDLNKSDLFCGVKRNISWMSSGSRVKILYHIDSPSFGFKGTYRVITTDPFLN